MNTVISWATECRSWWSGFPLNTPEVLRRSQKPWNNLSDNIWTNKSIISKEYVEDVDKDQYTIYNSPVRNPLIIRVSYYDLNVNNGVEKETLLFSDRGEDGDGWIKVDAGDPLIDLTTESSYTIKPNHIFKGWTPDKTGATEPIKTVTGLLGDVKLYACWDIAPSAIDVKAFAKDGIDSAVYAEGEVTLQGTIGVTGVSASNLAASYKWHKKGSSSTVSTTAGYRIQNVNDSGTYLYEYTQICCEHDFFSVYSLKVHFC